VARGFGAQIQSRHSIGQTVQRRVQMQQDQSRFYRGHIEHHIPTPQPQRGSSVSVREHPVGQIVSGKVIAALVRAFNPRSEQCLGCSLHVRSVTGRLWRGSVADRGRYEFRSNFKPVNWCDGGRVLLCLGRGGLCGLPCQRIGWVGNSLTIPNKAMLPVPRSENRVDPFCLSTGTGSLK